MPCSRAPFSNVPDTICKNVLLGYSKYGRPRWQLWLRVTDQCFQPINVLKDDSLINSDNYFVTKTPSRQSWTKKKGKPRPPSPPPQIKDGKMARICPSRAFILDLRGMGVCCSILFCPWLSESLDWRYSQRHDSNHDKKSAFKLFKAKCFQSKPGHLSVNSYKTEELRLFHLPYLFD